MTNQKEISSNSERKFDAILIGSGMGSLTVASILTQLKNLRVLVLEQHFVAGGQTHMFHRKGKYEFDVGVHYIGAMDRGIGKKAFDFVTGGKVKWQKMPDDFEVFSYPGFSFRVPSRKAEYLKRLIEVFPQEKLAIEKYFKDIAEASSWYSSALMKETLPAWVQPIYHTIFKRYGHHAVLTTGEYMDQTFKDPKLKALLVSQWGDYGLPPCESAFGMHAMVVSHYWRGAWYPIGGARSIAQAILPLIEKNGGKVLLRKKVSEILIRDQQAYGVRVHSTLHPEREPEDYFAPLIISGAGAFNTYRKMIPHTIDIPFRKEIPEGKGLSAVCVYLGLKESPEKLGIKGENHWVFEGIDHDQAEDEDEEGMLKLFYLSFPSLKNPQMKGHTADIITFMRYDRFAEWKNGKWKKRGPQYEAFKAEVANKMVQKVERYLPGFSHLIEFMDVSTPLTMEHFLKCEQGQFYGIPVTPSKLFQPWTRAKTPIKNLYLTGSDVVSPGVMGAMMGGVKTAGICLGTLGYFRLMRAIQRSP